MKKILILFALLLVACSGKPESPDPEPTSGTNPELRYTVTGYQQVVGETSDGQTFVFNTYDEPDALYTADRSHRLIYVVSRENWLLVNVALMPNDVQVFGATLYSGEIPGTVSGHRKEPITLSARSGNGTTITLTVVK